MSRQRPLHLYLFNPDDTSCQTCSANSSNFFIQGKGSQADKESGDSLRLGLGLGLGLGIPLAAGTAAAVWVLLIRRRARWENRWPEPQEEPLRAWKQQPSPDHTEIQTTPQKMSPYQAEGNDWTLEVDSRDVTELPSEHMVVEAPRQHERVELDGNVDCESRNGKHQTASQIVTHQRAW